jgi:hypothetical protein
MRCVVCGGQAAPGSPVCEACRANQGRIVPTTPIRPQRGVPLWAPILAVLLVGAVVGAVVVLGGRDDGKGGGASATGERGGVTTTTRTSAAQAEQLARLTRGEDLCDGHQALPAVPAFVRGAHQGARYWLKEPATDDVPHIVEAADPAPIDGGTAAGPTTVIACLHPDQVDQGETCTYNAIDLSRSWQVTFYGDVTYRMDLVELRTGKVLATTSLTAPGAQGCPNTTSEQGSSVAPYPDHDRILAAIHAALEP